MQVREEYESRTAEVYAFTSAKKMASILIRRDESTLRLYNKGAAEWVLKRCVSLHNEYGEVVPMTDAIREELLQVSTGCLLQQRRLCAYKQPTGALAVKEQATCHVDSAGLSCFN